VVHGCRHHVAQRMPVRRHGSCYIDQMHQASAQQISELIGVIGQNHFRHLRLRFAHRARLQITVVSVHVNIVSPAAGENIREKKSSTIIAHLHVAAASGVRPLVFNFSLLLPQGDDAQDASASAEGANESSPARSEASAGNSER
jgi:hypothetical protein